MTKKGGKTMGELKFSYMQAATPHPSKPQRFEITFNDGKKFELAAETDKLAKKWLTNLLFAVHSTRHFHVPLTHVRAVEITGYERPIPSVLVQMESYLVTHGGMDVEGIFRLAPNSEECALIKRQLDEGTFEELGAVCKDINCMSNLIKVFFRDLPEKVLDLGGLKAEKLSEATSLEQAAKDVAGMASQARSVLEWLLDLCVTVCAYTDVNKMSPQSMAIVFGPNLFVPSSDTNVYLQQMKRVNIWMQKAIEARVQLRTSGV